MAKKSTTTIVFSNPQLRKLTSMGMPAQSADALGWFNENLNATQQLEVLALANNASGGNNGNGSAAGAGGDDDQLTIERKRCAEITAISAAASLGDGWASNHIKRGSSIDDAKEAAAELSSMMINNPVVSGVGGGSDRGLDSIGPAISDAIALRAGTKLKQPHARAREFQGLTMIEIARQFAQSFGVDTRGMARSEIGKLLLSRNEFLRRARGGGDALAVHSSSDFPHLLADAASKTLRAAYEELAPSWPVWAREATAPDFKPVKRVSLSAATTPPAVGEGAEYTYATKSDAKEQYTVAKYGQIFKITWEALVNDDLDAFMRIQRSHGLSCARLEDDLAYAVLTANANMADSIALFDAATHKNLLTGSGVAAAISTESLSAARTKLALQTGLANEVLNLLAAFLLVPVGKEDGARQILSSTILGQDNTLKPVSPWLANIVPVANPRLDANSATAWYLLASPAQIDTVEVCFLEGMRMPEVTEEDGFDVDCRKYKVKHCVAAAAIDWRGMVKNTGA